MSNPLVELMKTGQSIWYDNIRRAMIESGDLARKIEEDDLRGITSNPTIFEKAITGSTDYDSHMRSLVAAKKSVEEIYEALILDDIASAADALLPVYEKTGGLDGFISLEVNPRLAYDTERTIEEAERLFRRLGRKNVMIKIPASEEGIPAIEESIRRGININITMIFAIENYLDVAEAFIRGLERRMEAGEPVSGIASVASFFVSRVDTTIDSDLERLAEAAGSEQERERLLALRGQAGIANARLAYQRFKEIFHQGERFARLRAEGAQVQRPLWASTGTKNPAYSDVLYVENLIGPETVNTIPPATYTAFRDHGRVALTLEQGVDDARRVIADLDAVGVDLRAVTDKLQTDGLKAFVGSFDALVESIEAKRAAVISGINERLTTSLGSYTEPVNEALSDADKRETTRRIWRKDAALWKTDEASRKTIDNSLGWLTVVETMKGVAGELASFADGIRSEFSHVVLCGMGGSSLAPEVLRRSFGKQDGYPELLVLDSTDPDAVRAIADRVEIGRTLFIIASKSGATTEPLAFYRYWYEEARKHREHPGEAFVAITDPGTLMHRMATSDQFRHIFLNPSDIGGRYSALSYFGLVPAALMGLDVELLLDRAERTMHACAAVVPVKENPGARLGAIISVCAAEGGRDKLTIIADRQIASFGLWVEQLVAESTGKEGKGIVPVTGEPVGAPTVYDGDDRLFVSISLGETSEESEQEFKQLEAAGHPVVRRRLSDLYDLAEEFFLWEFATAFAGARLGINPFDQPNVQESKDATKQLLEAFASDGRLEEQQPLVSDGTLTLYGRVKADEDSASVASVSDALGAHLAQLKRGDYVALLAYLEETPEHDEALQAIRTQLRDATRCATTVGYGPRFLHSTGQLHKGGPDSGVFLQLTAPDTSDLGVPGEPYTFSTLKEAQALGDFRALTSHQRRVIRIDLGSNPAAGLERLRQLLAETLAYGKAKTGAVVAGD